MKVQIASDTYQNQFYTVRLNAAGKAVSCTCPAGRSGTRCKHLHRAEMKSQFQWASRVFVRAFAYTSLAEGRRKEAFLSLFACKKARLAASGEKRHINLAIEEIIEVAKLAVQRERPEICIAEMMYERRVGSN